MRILSLKLRGAIGIQRGIGQEEIFLDFAQFNPGLIALAGRNGSGKTTIMENLHPYRRLVSREGSLYDHFYLKDSFRILHFVHNGHSYEAKILIDAMTSNSEAYLFCDGKPLNDGKVSTYDEELKRVLGSEDLFFNSVFSSQRSKGIAGLKPAEIRELFSELLNYTRYAVYLEKTKELSKTQEIKLAGLNGEIATLKSQLEKISANKEEIENMIYSKTELEARNKDNTIALEQQRGLKDSANTLLAKLREKEEQERTVKDDLARKERELADLVAKHEDEIHALSEEQKAKLRNFDEDNLTAQMVKRLRQDKIVAGERAEVNKREIQDIIAETEKMISNGRLNIENLQASIKRSRSILDNRDTINQKIKERQELSVKANELVSEQTVASSEINSLQNKKSASREKLDKIRSSKADLEKKISLLDADFNNLQKKREELIAEREQAIKEAEETIAIIEKVPCDEPTGSQCMFLARAHDTKRDLPEITENYNKKISDLDLAITDMAGSNSAEKIDLEQIVKEEAELNAEIAENFDKPIKKLELKIDEIKQDVKEVAGKLAEINKHDWDKLSKEATEADNNIKIKEVEIKAEESNIVNLQKTLDDNTKRFNEIETGLQEKIAEIDNQISVLSQKIETEREVLAHGYKERIDANIKMFQERKNDYEKQIGELKAKTDPELGAKILHYDNQLKEATEAIHRIEDNIEENKVRIAELTTKISEAQNALSQRQLHEDTINMKNAEAKFIEREIAEYNFLQRAFDKTGIPVLKLENSSIEVTAFANELLQFFDSGSRITFDTVAWTKDKKKLKEVFEINVIDEHGTTKLQMKSGGEKVWLESALQLAISLVARKQGRNIQTAFLDEKDDGLDIFNADFYLSMIQRAHELSGVHHTFVITHKTPLLEKIPQQIILGDGVKIVNTEVS